MKKMTLSFRSAVCPFLALVMAGGVLASCNKENSDPEIQLPEDYEETPNFPLPTSLTGFTAARPWSWEAALPDSTLRW